MVCQSHSAIQAEICFQDLGYKRQPLELCTAVQNSIFTIFQNTGNCAWGVPVWEVRLQQDPGLGDPKVKEHMTAASLLPGGPPAQALESSTLLLSGRPGQGMDSHMQKNEAGASSSVIAKNGSKTST